MCDSLWPHGLQDQVSLSITNSRSLLKLMSIKLATLSNHLSSVSPFFSCLQSLPASGSFPMRQSFASGGQTIGILVSVSQFIQLFFAFYLSRNNFCIICFANLVVRNICDMNLRTKILASVSSTLLLCVQWLFYLQVQLYAHIILKTGRQDT